ncbi:APC family permease [Streptosporangium sp. NPDC001559]|uniref:APC family permease n=1 Tax=Streptosporangium sp. NPDC001559 TaxID=3366187 RepID=UPI0036EE906F
MAVNESAATPATLSRRRIGVPDIVFFVVAASSPLTVAAGGTPQNFATTGVLGVPLMFLILAAVLALFSAGYAAMSRHISNAGAFYAYITHGLGRVPGVGAAFVALVAYNAMQVGLYGLLGFSTSGFLSGVLGVEVPWWIVSLVFLAVIALLGYRRIDLNARVLAVLLVCEGLLVLVFDISQIATAPQGLSLEPFGWNALTTGAVGAAFLWTMAAFMGFESGAIYSEECRDPRRTVSRATYIAVAVIGVFYAFTAWATAMGAGPGDVIAASREHGPELVFVLGERALGPAFSTLGQVFLITAVFAATLSFHNAVARYFFALGREGVLPEKLGLSHPRHGSPYMGSVSQTVFAAVVVLAFGLFGGDPMGTLFNWFTNLGALGVILLLVATSVAVVGFFRKERRGESAWNVAIAPVLAGLALFAVLYVAFTNFSALLGTPPDSALNWALPAVVVLVGVVGLIYGAYLRSADPRAYARIGQGAPVRD